MADDADKTARKQRDEVLRDNAFKPGQSGNPTGRPKGARNKLGKAFIKGLLKDFEKGGIAAIETTRAERPHEYLRVIASLLPKELTGENGGPIAIKITREIVRSPHPDG